MTIDDIQQKLKQESLDAYIIGYENRFLGQDILPQEHKIKYLCGFSGSAGMLAVTADKVKAYFQNCSLLMLALG